MSKPRVKVPKNASAGEAVTIKALVSHKMESGLRKDADGKNIPQMIIRTRSKIDYRYEIGPRL